MEKVNVNLTDLNKDVTYYILNKLDDYSLDKTCKTVKKFRNICNDEDFWKYRIISIFGNKSEEILNGKPENQSWKDFYLSKRYEIYSWCLDLLNVPKTSQMVIDDFYNPYTGFVNRGYTRDVEGMKYLLLKIVLERYNKDGLDNTKLIELLKEVKSEIPEYRENQFSDSLNLTEKEKVYFYQLIDIPIGRSEILRSNPKFINSLRRNAPEVAKLVVHINNGLKEGKIPLDIKWDELCKHPYLYTGKLIF